MKKEDKTALYDLSWEAMFLTEYSGPYDMTNCLKTSLAWASWDDVVNQGTIFISALTSCTQGLWILIPELPCKTDAASFLVSVGSKLTEVANEDE